VLILKRAVNESIVIRGDIRVVIVGLDDDHGRGRQVRLGIDAPAHVNIRRAELPRREPQPPHRDWIEL